MEATLGEPRTRKRARTQSGAQGPTPTSRSSAPFTSVVPPNSSWVPPVFHDSLRRSRDASAPSDLDSDREPAQGWELERHHTVLLDLPKGELTHALIPRSVFEEISRDTWWNSS